MTVTCTCELYGSGCEHPACKAIYERQEPQREPPLKQADKMNTCITCWTATEDLLYGMEPVRLFSDQKARCDLCGNIRTGTFVWKRLRK